MSTGDGVTEGPYLTAGDPEPPEGTVVLDDMGTYWERDDDGAYGRIRWRKRDREDDPETWIKVAGNYGPVTVVEERKP